MILLKRARRGGLASAIRADADNTETYDTPLEILGLSTRTYNALKRSGITTVGQVVEMADKDVSNIRNMGAKSVEEIIARLQEHAYRNNPDEVDSR
jgi:DNA-directed RNA polymerase subunit alpha